MFFIDDILKIFIPTTVTFCVGIILSIFLSHYLYKYQMWKKKSGKRDPSGAATPIFDELHKNKEVGTPKMGGVVIWLSAFLTIASLWFLARLLPFGVWQKLDLLSRNQTWIPLCTLLLGGFVGLIDDFLEVKGNGDYVAGGLSLKKRLFLVALISLGVALWFYFKLEVWSVGIPLYGELYLGWLFIPFFVIVTIGLYSGGVIDGLDGLAGGIFSIIFFAYAVIAFYQNQINLAAFCAVIVGGLLAFLWFNIPPARFYMSETGSMALTITLAVVAFMTDSLSEGHGISALPIIAFPLIATSLSDVIQLSSKKWRGGKKIFLVAPIHHHFEAKGWPSYKVTMRFWVIGVMFATIGMIIALIR